ncbi:MAG TPA: deoxynucleoside kinase [Porticoccaceae bacterium]|nr:deoxynucleoside kinase [Porticoccaceae bacterium]HCO60789.1 deoxynucleoside kinase [Porticoccaceae bacterium]
MEVLANDIELNLKAETLPRYIAVEGPIGVGKTAFARRLATTFNYDTLLEQAEENPFLERFYKDLPGAALPTQLYFLFQRVKQIQSLRQDDMFKPLRIADFLVEKDPLFAQVTLDDDELRLYQNVFDQLVIDCPKPDLVIYLQAPSDILLERVLHRGIPMEQNIDKGYLNALNEAYQQFFHYYEEAPLLIVNAEAIDPVHNDLDYRNLVQYLLTVKCGRQYYNPQPHL